MHSFASGGSLKGVLVEKVLQVHSGAVFESPLWLPIEAIFFSSAAPVNKANVFTSIYLTPEYTSGLVLNSGRKAKALSIGPLHLDPNHKISK